MSLYRSKLRRINARPATAGLNSSVRAAVQIVRPDFHGILEAVITVFFDYLPEDSSKLAGMENLSA